MIASVDIDRAHRATTQGAACNIWGLVPEFMVLRTSTWGRRAMARPSMCTTSFAGLKLCMGTSTAVFICTRVQFRVRESTCLSTGLGAACLQGSSSALSVPAHETSPRMSNSSHRQSHTAAARDSRLMGASTADALAFGAGASNGNSRVPPYLLIATAADDASGLCRPPSLSAFHTPASTAMEPPWCYTEKAPNAWQRRGTQETRNTHKQPNRPNRQT